MPELKLIYPAQLSPQQLNAAWVVFFCLMFHQLAWTDNAAKVYTCFPCNLVEVFVRIIFSRCMKILVNVLYSCPKYLIMFSSCVIFFHVACWCLNFHKIYFSLEHFIQELQSKKGEREGKGWFLLTSVNANWRLRFAFFCLCLCWYFQNLKSKSAFQFAALLFAKAQYQCPSVPHQCLSEFIDLWVRL